MQDHFCQFSVGVVDCTQTHNPNYKKVVKLISHQGLYFQHFGYHVSVRHDEKHPQPKFGGNQYMGARNMAT